MKINVERGAFLKALGHVQSVVERRNTIPILSNVLIQAAKGRVKLTATDLDIEIVESLPSDVLRNGAATAPAHMLYDIVRKMPEGSQVQAEALAGDSGRLAVSAGSVRFELACLPQEDFPQMSAGTLPHRFRLAASDLIALIEKTRFAISTEETRFYLNGIYLHAAKDGKQPHLRAVATDGHRLARYELDLPDGAKDMPGVIIPRKTVAELRRLLEDAEDAIEVGLSDTKIQFTFGGVELTSKLIDGSFPDYQRVIPTSNDKVLSLDAKDFSQAVDRVSTISVDRTRAVKLNLDGDKVTLSVVNPESGTATEELGANYSADPIEIGFNARYLLDITGQIAGKDVRFLLADAGSPTLIEDTEDARTLYVLMPMRVYDPKLIRTARLMDDADERPELLSPACGAIPLALTGLSLVNFRSYASARLEVESAPVVLAGANGTGKTNVLEAISLFSPGRGLRGAKIAELQRKAPTEAERSGAFADSLWAVSATVARPEGVWETGTASAAHADGRPSRLLHLNGAPAASADVAELVPMLWLTPALDRLFLEGAGERRRFLDRLTFALDSAHAKRAARYERAMQERLKLLKDGVRDPAWLDGLEDAMAQEGSQLTQSRLSAVERLNAELSARGAAGAFPCAHLALKDALSESAADAGALQTALATSRTRDAEAGRTLAGPHLADLEVRHTAKRADARDCSTGEQKALLVSIVLANAWLKKARDRGVAPILLLDEIAAHLDAMRRAALFEEILALGTQAWLTGTDKNLFAPILPRAQCFSIHAGAFVRQD